MIPRDARGITLTELTVVMLLAAMVMTGLVTFYLTSQQMWLDGAPQALTQRDATLLLERMTAETHQSAHAEVRSNPDSAHQTLILRDADDRERCRFLWEATDGLVHYQRTDSLHDE